MKQLEIEYPDWFDNTIIQKREQTDNVVIIRIGRPNTLEFSIDYTFLSDPQAILITADAGQAIFNPTWNPVKIHDYHRMNRGYLLQKLACSIDDDTEFYEDVLEKDWGHFADSYKGDTRMLEIARNFVNNVIIPNNGSLPDIEIEMPKLCDDLQGYSYDYYEDSVANVIKYMGQDINQRNKIWIEGLNVLDAYNIFDKSIENVVLGEPSKFRG